MDNLIFILALFNITAVLTIFFKNNKVLIKPLLFLLSSQLFFIIANSLLLAGMDALIYKYFLYIFYSVLIFLSLLVFNYTELVHFSFFSLFSLVLSRFFSQVYFASFYGSCLFWFITLIFLKSVFKSLTTKSIFVFFSLLFLLKSFFGVSLASEYPGDVNLRHIINDFISEIGLSAKKFELFSNNSDYTHQNLYPFSNTVYAVSKNVVFVFCNAPLTIADSTCSYAEVLSPDNSMLITPMGFSFAQITRQDKTLYLIPMSGLLNVYTRQSLVSVLKQHAFNDLLAPKQDQQVFDLRAIYALTILVYFYVGANLVAYAKPRISKLKIVPVVPISLFLIVILELLFFSFYFYKNNFYSSALNKIYSSFDLHKAVYYNGYLLYYPGYATVYNLKYDGFSKEQPNYVINVNSEDTNAEMLLNNLDIRRLFVTGNYSMLFYTQFDISQATMVNISLKCPSSGALSFYHSSVSKIILDVYYKDEIDVLRHDKVPVMTNPGCVVPDKDYQLSIPISKIRLDRDSGLIIRLSGVKENELVSFDLVTSEGNSVPLTPLFDYAKKGPFVSFSNFGSNKVYNYAKIEFPYESSVNSENIKNDLMNNFKNLYGKLHEKDSGNLTIVEPLFESE